MTKFYNFLNEAVYYKKSRTKQLSKYKLKTLLNTTYSDAFNLLKTKKLNIYRGDPGSEYGEIYLINPKTRRS